MRQSSKTNPPESSSFWLDLSSSPTISTIHLVRRHLTQRLPTELVDLIFDFAEFWAHSTTTLNEPVRAFGPFTWDWHEGMSIDYLNVWCPFGPAYAFPWKRWGESRRENSFLLRSPPIGVKVRASRHHRHHRFSRLGSLLGKKGVVRFILRCRGRGKPGGGYGSDEREPRTAAVKKIVFETYSHQDYFGAIGDTADETLLARVFCDVGIYRKLLPGRKASGKGRLLAADISKVDKSSNKQGRFIVYKPFVLETRGTHRYYFSKYHVNTWRWDDDAESSPPSDQTFPTAREFLRRLEVGDTVGVWGRIGKGETYHIIDAMGMHIFWAV